MYTFTGKVTDAQTHEPLYPAAVALVGSGGIITGVMTNADGTFNFSVQNPDPILQLTFSYVGYESQTVTKQDSPYNIQLQPTAAWLNTTTVTATKYPTLKFALAVLLFALLINFITKK